MKRHLRKVRFAFDEGPEWSGYTDGTTWNGWLNVWVAPATRDAIVKWMIRSGMDRSTIRSTAHLPMREIDGKLLVSLHGYTVVDAKVRRAFR